MGDWWHDTFGYPVPRNKKKYSDDDRKVSPEDNYAYQRYLDQLENAHGGERVFWENFPYYGQINWVRSKYHRADDSYNKTGVDDYYGDKYYYGGLLPLLQGIGSSAGIRPRPMSTTLSGLYDAEIEEDLTWEKWSKYDPETQRMHEYGKTHKTRHKR